MKNKWILLLILALLFSACGHTDPVPETVATPSLQTEQTAGATDKTMAEATSTDASSAAVIEETDAMQTTQAAPPEDVILIDPGEYSWRDGHYTLLDQENCRLEMIFAKSISKDSTFIAYMVQNHSDSDYMVTIEDVLLNETVQINENARISVSAGSQEIYQSYWVDSPLENSCLWIGYENIKKLSAKVEIVLPDWSVLDSVNCAIDFPEGIPLRYVYGPFRSMRADRQVLRSDETMTLALLGCGSFYADGGEWNMTGYLWAENTGETEIPISIANISVNGMIVSESQNSFEVLAPGASCIKMFYVSYTDFDAVGIEAIESVQLQILTSYEENTAGNYSSAGGVWYPLALAQSGKASEPDGEQQVIYDDGLLEICFDHAGVENRESYYMDDQPLLQIVYYVLVSNRRAEGISLEIIDPYMDGKLYHVHCSKRSFGPESKGMMEIIVYIPKTEEEVVPELSFLLRVRSQGGDSIFYTTSERIILTGK